MAVFKKDGIHKLGASYIPAEIPHRRSHEEEIVRTFLPLTERKTQIPWSLLVTGPSGTGKTVTVKKAINRIVETAREKGTKLLTSYLNCRFASTDFSLAQMIAMSAIRNISGRGFSATELISATDSYLSEEDVDMILVLDDFDVFFRANRYRSKTIDDLLKMHESGHSKIYTIMVAVEDVSQSFQEKWISNYVWRTKEKYKPYTYEEVFEILANRVEEAFQPDVVSEDLILMASRMTEKFGYGSARYGLELMLASGLEAEWRQGRRVMPEHLRIAQGRIESLLSLETIRSLSEPAKAVLSKLVNLLKDSDLAYIDLESSLPELDKNVMREMRRLDLEGLLDFLEKGGVKVGLIGCPAESLGRFLGSGA
jgi:Cdc6-like AAA superfamily ATPase